MPSQDQDGSQTATINTEHTLGSAITAAGTYALMVDTAALANGDVLELRIYTIARSGGTERLHLKGSWRNAQTKNIKQSIPVMEVWSWKATLKQTAGTGRAFPWSIRKV